MLRRGARISRRVRRHTAGWTVACALLSLAWPAAAESPRFGPRAWQPAPVQTASATKPKGNDKGKTEAPAAPAQQGSTGLLGLHSDFRFSLLAPRKSSDVELVGYQAQVKKVAARLQAAAQKAYPDECKRVGTFDVYVGDAEALATMSSGTGKIAVNAGFARLQPSDAWLAFVIAREMGHVLAGHHDSNAGASIAVSVAMNLILPGTGLLKSALSLGGSEMASGSRHDRQNREADEIAFKLIDGAGYGVKPLARGLRLKPLGEDISKTAWAADFRTSVARLEANPPGAKPVRLAAGAQAARGRTPAPIALVNYAPPSSAADSCAACATQP